MRQRLFLFLLSVWFIASAMAQTSVSGVVKTDDGVGMDFVSVIASPANAPKTILASVFTDENGKFHSYSLFQIPRKFYDFRDGR